MEKQKIKRYSKTIPIERKKVSLEDIVKSFSIVEKYTDRIDVKIFFSDNSSIEGNDIEIFDEYLLKNKKTDNIKIVGYINKQKGIILEFENGKSYESLGYVKISLTDEIKYNALISQFTNYINCLEKQFFISVIPSNTFLIVLYAVLTGVFSFFISGFEVFLVMEVLEISGADLQIALSVIALTVANWFLLLFFLKLFPNIEFTFGNQYNKKIINFLAFLFTNILIPILIGLLLNM